MLKTLSLATLAIVATAGSALAGPVGSGLGLTESVARRAQLTVAVAASGEACAAAASQALQGHASVQSVAHDAKTVRVTFRSAAAAAEHRSTVDAAVNRACG